MSTGISQCHHVWIGLQESIWSFLWPSCIRYDDAGGYKAPRRLYLIRIRLIKRVYMTANEKNDFLYALVQNYVIEKQNNVVYNRDNAESYSYAKGRLNGALTAFDLDMVETPGWQ